MWYIGLPKNIIKDWSTTDRRVIYCHNFRHLTFTNHLLFQNLPPAPSPSACGQEGTLRIEEEATGGSTPSQPVCSMSSVGHAQSALGSEFGGACWQRNWHLGWSPTKPTKLVISWDVNADISWDITNIVNFILISGWIWSWLMCDINGKMASV